MPQPATAQNFLEAAVSIGKARQRLLAPNQIVITRWCQVCGQPAEHISAEEGQPSGAVFERITCCECGETYEVKIR